MLFYNVAYLLLSRYKRATKSIEIAEEVLRHPNFTPGNVWFIFVANMLIALFYVCVVRWYQEMACRSHVKSIFTAPEWQTSLISEQQTVGTCTNCRKQYKIYPRVMDIMGRAHVLFNWQVEQHNSPIKDISWIMDRKLCPSVSVIQRVYCSLF